MYQYSSSTSSRHFRLGACALTSSLILLSASLCGADSRDDARQAIADLQQTGASRKLAGEVASISSTFATAEEYYQRNDRETAERYYLLCVQKSRVLMSSLVPQERKPLTPPSVLQTSESPSPSESSPSPPQEQSSSSDQASPPQGMATPDSKKVAPFVPQTVRSPHLVGRTSLYTVKKRDTLRLISAKLGVSRRHLIRMNRLSSARAIKPGQKLRYNNRKIIPRRMAHGIVINIPDRTLYYFKEGKLASSLPVAVGLPHKGEKYDWMTPTGKFKVVSKKKDPTWHVPLSIRSEMEAQGKEVTAIVPPGPHNPLGKYAIRTSLPGILIHSTTRPGSIYGFASHGCIRVYPERMKELFNEIVVNTPGEIIYQPVKLAVTEEGRVYLEVHRDAYNKKEALEKLTRRLIEKRNIADQVDWDKVKTVVREKEGLAQDVSL